MKKKHLHIMTNDKFINGFIEFINKNFNKEEHTFIIIDGINEKELKISENKNVIKVKSKGQNIKNNFLKKIFYCLQLPILFIQLFFQCKKNEKVFFHGMNSSRFILFLYLFPSFLKKSYWIMWGGDLYCYRNRDKNPSLLKRLYYHMDSKVKGNFKGYIIEVKGDYKLAQKFYNAQGKLYSNFGYPSNFYKKIELEPQDREKKEICIQVGNSGDPSNNHFAILEKLKKFKEKNIKLYCILSYGGSETYKKELIKQGKIIFGDKFIPILDFMKFDEYMKFLSKIDIAIFAHDRQQAFGNITSLLSMKKTVYIKNNISTFEFLNELGIEVKDFNKLEELEIYNNEIIEKNKEIIKNYFSEENLIKMWENAFYD